MRIKKIRITNFKSLVDLNLKDLNPFSAFIGPNASGKSNIFEAFEFANFVYKYVFEAAEFFGGRDRVYSYNAENQADSNSKNSQSFYFEFGDSLISDFVVHYTFDIANDSQNKIVAINSGNFLIGNTVKQLDATDVRNPNKRKQFISQLNAHGIMYEDDFEIFVDNFSRIFIGNSGILRFNESPGYAGSKLVSDASNLSYALAAVLSNDKKREDFLEWVRILIPEFENIQIKKSSLDYITDFLIYEKFNQRPFERALISDGTNNILSLMCAVYQSDRPQFLCIEEPENGLHPQAIELMVDFFREKSEEFGHHIFINTHSPTLVRKLKVNEIILVNKIKGSTKIKQLTESDNYGLPNDDAWLSNAFGGGILW